LNGVKAPCPVPSQPLVSLGNTMEDQDAEIERLKRAIERAKSLNKQLRAQIGDLTRLIEKSKACEERSAEINSRALAE
jgi:septal ring factor EnvC (AmiA/AmiB activator)